ncbi:hypothetical protein [Reinekea sp.]|jgi:hypothetical protein|uniref:hypothetical protein n=1 Tax=Reinekea sp. TaxID=1970455 RepID=UPI003989766F
MNLLTAFARIKVLFNVTKRPTMHVGDLNAHMRKDLGLDYIHKEIRNKDHAPKSEGIVTYGILTRGP